MINEKLIRAKFLQMDPTLDERSRRRWVATEANALGRGGISAVARATGVARLTIAKGIKELGTRLTTVSRLRKEGGGRKKLSEKDPTLERDLEELIESMTRETQSQHSATLSRVRVC